MKHMNDIICTNLCAEDGLTVETTLYRDGMVCCRVSDKQGRELNFKSYECLDELEALGYPKGLPVELAEVLAEGLPEFIEYALDELYSAEGM